jgi:hypothetical protein
MDVRCWFSHIKGSYDYIYSFRTVEEAEKFWADDPYFLGAYPASSDEKPPTVVEEHRYLREMFEARMAGNPNA